jgi:hypothetical protein
MQLHITNQHPIGNQHHMMVVRYGNQQEVAQLYLTLIYRSSSPPAGVVSHVIVLSQCAVFLCVMA